MNYFKLAELHSNIWFEHDKLNYNLIQTNAKKFLLFLGFEKNKADEASKSIKNSYYFYDQAVKNKNNEIKKQYFDKMTDSHKKVMRILDFSEENGENYSRWWIGFSDKKYWKVTTNLLKYHYNFLKGGKKLSTPLLTLLIVLAGLVGHNKRNKKTTELFLSWYWKIMLLIANGEFIIY